MNASPYQNSKFFAREKRILEEIPNAKYLSSLRELDPNLPVILITNTHTAPEEIAPALLEQTVLMIHPNSGHDNYQKEFVKNASFPIILGNPIRSHAVFEYTLSCIFHHFIQVPSHQHWSDSREWNRKLLRDQKVVILGYGHIGKLLERTLSSICQSVTVIDPYVKANGIFPSLHLDQLSDVNILIAAASLTDSSYKMIKSDELKKLSPEALIINPARGGIICEESLIHFLQQNPLAKAFLDVFEEEPFKPGLYNQLENLNKTSHIAGVHKKLNQDIISFEYLIIKDFIQLADQNKTADFFGQYQECLLTEDLYYGKENHP